MSSLIASCYTLFCWHLWETKFILGRDLGIVEWGKTVVVYYVVIYERRNSITHKELGTFLWHIIDTFQLNEMKFLISNLPLRSPGILLWCRHYGGAGKKIRTFKFYLCCIISLRPSWDTYDPVSNKHTSKNNLSMLIQYKLLHYLKIY